MAFKLLFYNSLSSTQDLAKKLAQSGQKNIAIISIIQKKGRGRFKRKWHSGKGGLWVSFLFNPTLLKIHYLTFLASVAVVDTIKKIAKLNAKIKWPNDIHFNSKKLCGILTEGIFGKEAYAIVGIGLNINQQKFNPEIKDTATSLKILTKKDFSVKIVAKSLSDHFYSLYKNYYENGKFDKIKMMWKLRSDTLGKKITAITSKKEEINGTAIDVDADCNLVVKTNKGKIIKIIEADVSIRY